MKKNLLLLLAGTLFLFRAVAQQPLAHKKLSPILEMLISSDREKVEFAKRNVLLRTVPEVTEPLVKAFLQFKGDPHVLERHGVRIHTVAGEFATVDIPISALGRILENPNVIWIEEARKVKPVSDTSVPATGANKVWGAEFRPLPPPWPGNTGRGVVVGIVDSGIHFNHADFKDASGKTRVLSIWDQTTGARGSHPAGYNYGNECTRQQIDDSFQKTDLATSNAFNNTQCRRQLRRVLRCIKLD